MVQDENIFGSRIKLRQDTEIDPRLRILYITRNCFVIFTFHKTFTVALVFCISKSHDQHECKTENFVKSS